MRQVAGGGKLSEVRNAVLFAALRRTAFGSSHGCSEALWRWHATATALLAAEYAVIEAAEVARNAAAADVVAELEELREEVEGRSREAEAAKAREAAVQKELREALKRRGAKEERQAAPPPPPPPPAVEAPGDTASEASFASSQREQLEEAVRLGDAQTRRALHLQASVTLSRQALGRSLLRASSKASDRAACGAAVRRWSLAIAGAAHVRALGAARQARHARDEAAAVLAAARRGARLGA